MSTTSVEGMVNVALAMQNQTIMQQKDNLLLRKVLDNQANTVLSLVEGATGTEQLASGGTVGTRLHTTA